MQHTSYFIAQKCVIVAFLQYFLEHVSYHRSVNVCLQGKGETMNRLMQEKWPWIEGSHGMRSQILDLISDPDLAFNPGGQNKTLGELCREMGDTEHSYIQSLKTFQQDWSYHNTQVGLESSVVHLKAWFQTLDEELQTVISALSDEDVTKTVDRGGYPMPVGLQLDVYLQALLIFFGKATIYLKTMNKSLPKEIQEYIG